MKKYLCCLLLAAFFSEVYSEEVFRSKKDKVSMRLSPNGTLSEVVFEMDGGRRDTVKFRHDDYAGPSFGKDVVMGGIPGDRLGFAGERDGLRYSIRYETGCRYVDIHIGVENRTDSVFMPDRLPFYLGIDTYMNSYPEWNSLYFPTFFRCEKNHFWGYLMSPQGHILCVSSPDTVASYSYLYLNEMYGHYIYTVSADLLCGSPLPRHHVSFDRIEARSSKHWTLRLSPVVSLDSVESQVAVFNGASLIELNTHSAEINSSVKIRTVGPPARISVQSPSGEKCDLGVASGQNSQVYDNTVLYGLYWVEAVNDNGKVSTASFYVHPPWSWYLKRARELALVHTPKADKSNDSCETWYQLLGFYLAEKYYPDRSLKNIGDKFLSRVLDSLFVEKNGLMHTVVYPERIQNVSAMVSILALKYSADKKLGTLEIGAKCVDYLLSRQHSSGYYGGYGMAHYTSVLYIAKSIMEFMEQIKPLSESEPKWKERYDRYSSSVSRAIEELSNRGRDVRTEGGATFEDGSVSCSASQLLYYALTQEEDLEKRMKYQNAGLVYLQDHSCLTRLLDPDARSRGATSRFWECWGDIRTPMQAMLSPHGWSGWRLYASYYAYLLTGEGWRLQQLMDALGACTQLIDYPKGDLHAAFVIDPHYSGGVLLPQKGKRNGCFTPAVQTAGYLNCIGDWYGQNTEGDGYLERAGWDWEGSGVPFEIIKAMEEIALCNAFVCENSGGLAGYNCHAERVNDREIHIDVEDDIVSKIHINLKGNSRVIVSRKGKVFFGCSLGKGMQWITIK